MNENNRTPDPDYITENTSDPQAPASESGQPPVPETPDQGLPPQNDGWNQPPQNDGWNQPPQNGGWNQPPQNNGWNQPQFYPEGPGPQKNDGPEKPADKKEVTAVLLGIISILVSCCCFPAGVCLGFAAAMTGLVLCILSRQEGLSGYGIGGMILSIIGLVESLILFGCYLLTVQMLKDPQFSALLNELLRQYPNGLLP